MVSRFVEYANYASMFGLEGISLELEAALAICYIANYLDGDGCISMPYDGSGAPKIVLSISGQGQLNAFAVFVVMNFSRFIMKSSLISKQLIIWI